jgi:uncharacterized protein
MRVIVTGGTGLVGSLLVENLARDGHEVIVLTRSTSKSSGEPRPGVRQVEWDARTALGWGELVDGAEAIIHLASDNLNKGLWTEAKKHRIRASRVEPGLAIAEAVENARQKPRVLIQASSVGYYGPHKDERLVTEKTPPGKDFLASVCQEWEKSTAGIEHYGVRRPIIRSGVILHLQNPALRRMEMRYRLFVGGPAGTGKQWLPWIHIADVIAAIRFLMDNGRANGPFNLTAPHPLTNRSFGRVLAKTLHRPAYFPVPGFVVKAIFGEMSIVVLEGQRAVPKRLQELGFRFRFPEAEPALRDLYGRS